MHTILITFLLYQFFDKYTCSIQAEHHKGTLKLQWSISSNNFEKENLPKAYQEKEKRKKKKKALSNLNLSSHTLQSTLHFFLQIHHIKQWGLAFQISLLWCRSTWHSQQASKSLSILGITHKIPKRVKTIPHNSLAIGQCKWNWFIVSSSLLHIKYQFT